MPETLRGHLDVQDIPVSFGGLDAVYSLAERALMQGLPPREALVIHTLKALCGGELVETDDASLDPELSFAPSAPETEEGPVPAPRRRRNEPLPGQTAVAV